VAQWLTIHDLNFEHHPEWVPTHVGKYYRKHIRRGSRIASQLFTVSEWSAKDLVHTYGIAAGKIAITRNAPQRKFTPGPSSFSGPYFCAVGALTPRKNIITLIKAFDQWIGANPSRDNFKLRIAGTAHFNDPAFNEAFKGIIHRDKIEWLGRCEDDQLEELYRGATAFCMPSAMEGFGIPIVEAMQCGTPVIASDNSALTEVVGGAGMLVPTYDVLAWVEALEHMAEHANEWTEKSLNHGTNFNWTQSAEPFITALKNHE
jgi:glycosyltransferase involved in cell wall biosynthesis